MPFCRLTSNSLVPQPEQPGSALAYDNSAAPGSFSADLAAADETAGCGPCVRCDRPGAPWRLAAYVCQLCWAEAFAEQVAADDAARQQRERAERAERAMAARQILVACGVRRQVTARMPDWAVLGLLERVEATPVAEVAAWTRVVVEPVGWLVAVREHSEQLRALRGQRGRFRAGRSWTDTTLLVAHALMHHAGRVGAADGRVLAWPGMATLMSFTGLSKGTVRNALRTLCWSGFLRRVLVGTRVAGLAPGQPVSLATVFELRVPLTSAELVEQAELQRTLQRVTSARTTGPADRPDHGCPQATGCGACTPPSSCNDLSGSLDLKYTDARQNPSSHQPDPQAEHSPRRQRNAALAQAATELRSSVDALRKVTPAVVEGLLRSWWERHQPHSSDPRWGWGLQLATELGPWPPRRVVTSPVGLLQTRLSRLDRGAATPAPGQPLPVDTRGSLADQLHTAGQRGAALEQQQMREEIVQREHATAEVNRRAHYERIAQQLGWRRSTPAALGEVGA